MTTATSTRAAARPSPLIALAMALALAASFIGGIWASGLTRSTEPVVATAPSPAATFDAVQFRADERALR